MYRGPLPYLSVMNINESNHHSLTQWKILRPAAAQPHYHNLFNYPTAKQATMTSSDQWRIQKMSVIEGWGSLGAEPRPGRPTGSPSQTLFTLDTSHYCKVAFCQRFLLNEYEWMSQAILLAILHINVLNLTKSHLAYTYCRWGRDTSPHHPGSAPDTVFVYIYDCGF